jgi:hypothetical protein
MDRPKLKKTRMQNCVELVHHDDIFRHDCFPHMVKGECIVPLVKLGMGVSGTLDDDHVVTKDVTDIMDRNTKVT